MDEKCGSKLEKAQKLKTHLLEEKLINKFVDGVEFFKKHWAFREKNRQANIELYKLYEERRRENVQVFSSIFNSFFSGIFRNLFARIRFNRKQI